MGEANNKLKEDKNDKKPDEQKKDEQAKEEPASAVEAKKTEENIFDVRVVCVIVCDLFKNSVSDLFLLLAEEDQPTDFSFGQS